MPILVDGNNLLHRMPSGSQSREAVRKMSLDLVRREGLRLTLVFDGPPASGAPATENLGKLTVVYSGSRSADDVIVNRLPRGKPARSWVVVTDDRRLRQRAGGRGAEVRSLAQWREKLCAAQSGADASAQLSPHEVEEWEAYFSRGPDDEG